MMKLKQRRQQILKQRQQILPIVVKMQFKVNLKKLREEENAKHKMHKFLRNPSQTAYTTLIAPILKKHPLRNLKSSKQLQQWKHQPTNLMIRSRN